MRAGNIQRICFSCSLRCLVCVGLVISGLLLSACGSTPPKASKANKPAHSYQKSNAKYHRVSKGDTLYAVSWKAGVDYKTLAGWNGLRAPYIIYPGQQLRLTSPGSKKKTTTKVAKPKPKTSTKSTSRAAAPAKQTKSTVRKASSVAKGSGKTVTTGNAQLKWIWPVKGKLVGTFSSSDSSRAGIKIAGSRGKKIQAAETGQVVYVGSGLVGYGRLIIIKHNNKYLSAYGHNNKLLVTEGDVVKKGQHIADMGLAHSGQAMLHFEIRKYGKPVNPVTYLP